jgi:5,10-methylenetetrahydrofolate reductase
MKIIDKINAKGSEAHIAFAYFPPRTEDGVKNLTRRFKVMATQEPLCVAPTAAPWLRGERAKCGARVEIRASPQIPSALRQPLLTTTPTLPTRCRYADMTWGAGGSTSDLTLDLCVKMKAAGLEPNMHLTCTNMCVSRQSALLPFHFALPILFYGISHNHALRIKRPAQGCRAH